MERGEEVTLRFEKVYIATMLLIPFLCVLFPVIFEMYSKERIHHEVGCWFTDAYSWGRIVFFDGWIFVSWIYIAVVLVLAQRLVHLPLPAPPFDFIFFSFLRQKGQGDEGLRAALAKLYGDFC